MASANPHCNVRPICMSSNLHTIRNGAMDVPVYQSGRMGQRNIQIQYISSPFGGHFTGVVMVSNYLIHYSFNKTTKMASFKPLDVTLK